MLTPSSSAMGTPGQCPNLRVQQVPDRSDLTLIWPAMTGLLAGHREDPASVRKVLFHVSIGCSEVLCTVRAAFAVSPVSRIWVRQRMARMRATSSAGMQGLGT